MSKPTWRLWFDKAASDLKVAKFLVPQSKTDEGFLGALVFHSQQVAEKSIKGYLTFHRKRFGKTHNIAELLKVVEEVDSNFGQALKPSEILTDFAVAYRYPEESKLQTPLTAESGENALKLANWVFEETRSRVDRL